ncbi:MAG: hypothetical protein U0166_12955 [Acidobacteriota bacterium]
MNEELALKESARAAATLAPARLFLSGNEAIARGAWEAGVRFAAAYPGTPSTEILETPRGFPASGASGRSTRRSPSSARWERRSAERGRSRR